MAVNRKIKITDLLINTDNYRFEPVNSQKEALNQMLEDQGDYLYTLAEHIIQNGLNPMDRIVVTGSSHFKTKFIVIEGNRRTVAIKLLHNPDSIEDSKFLSLKKKFKKLSAANLSKIPKDVECVVYDDPKDSDVWTGLKHGYGDPGAVTNTWGTLQKQRFSERTEGKTSTSLQIIKLIKESEDVPVAIKTGVDKISVTNLDRLISDPSVRDFLGINIVNGVIQSKIERKEVIKGLTQVVKDILRPGFKVKNIYNKDDRQDYIKAFPTKSIPDLSKKSEKPWQLNNLSTSTPAIEKTPKKIKELKERSTLIPKTCVININVPKIDTIYHELIKLDISKFTNACAVLFRVFIELSVDCYIENHKLINSPTSTKSGTPFLAKMNIVINHLNQRKISDDAMAKEVKTAVNNPNNILGLDTWHAYVHNHRFSPKEKELMLTWDGMQDFMVILWNNIK